MFDPTQWPSRQSLIEDRCYLAEYVTAHDDDDGDEDDDHDGGGDGDGYGDDDTDNDVDIRKIP